MTQDQLKNAVLFEVVLFVQDGSTILKNSANITGEVSITAFASGAGLPFGISLRQTNLSFPLTAAITQRSFKIFIREQENTMKLSCLLKAS